MTWFPRPETPLIVMLAVVFGKASVASAAFTGSTTIDFDDFPDGTCANELYAEQGIEFSRDDGMPVPIMDWAGLGRNTTSKPNVIGTVSGGFECRDVESHVTHLNVTFDSAMSELGAFFGNDQGMGYSHTTLTVFDIDGGVVGSVVVPTNDNTDVDQFIGLSTDVPFFSARFDNDGNALSVVLDDVSFATFCLPGDLDGNGAVGFGDVLAVLSAWGNEGGPEDLDESGTVDFGDLLIVLTNWGPCFVPVGACCFPDGACAHDEEDACESAGGFYQGDGRRCGACGVPSDACEDAPLVGDGTYAYSTLLASTDGPSLPPECDEGNGRTFRRDVWIRYEASCTGVATASVCDSDYDTRLAVYRPPGCAGEIIACSDDACGEGGTRSETTFPVVRGERYFVRIGGRVVSGTGTVMLSCEGGVR